MTETHKALIQPDKSNLSWVDSLHRIKYWKETYIVTAVLDSNLGASWPPWFYFWLPEQDSILVAKNYIKELMEYNKLNVFYLALKGLVHNNAHVWFLTVADCF